jgi:hypothetical protein
VRSALAAAFVLLAAMTGGSVLGQTRTPLQPTAPGTTGDPVWQAKLQLTDGRVFVTDGGLAIDAALAKPSPLPERTVPSKILEDAFAADHKDEYRLSDLAAGANGRSYVAPNGIPLSSTYVNFLRRVAPRSVRLRMIAPMRPVIVMDGDKPIGVLMPVAR